MRFSPVVSHLVWRKWHPHLYAHVQPSVWLQVLAACEPASALAEGLSSLDVEVYERVDCLLPADNGCNKAAVGRRGGTVRTTGEF